MTAVYNILLQRVIRLGQPLSLIFFAFFFTQGCKQKPVGEISVIWSGNQATGIVIPLSILHNSNHASVKTDLQIRLEKSSVAMLGEFEKREEQVVFNSLIPFSPGRTYSLFYRGRLLGELSIPYPGPANAASLISIYPSADTLPENLLKIYLQFSAPMREGDALQHIHFLNESGDTVPNIFLDLQPELWDKERTALTVWLDPGRIKRELIPNELLGAPLQKGKRYTLAIDDNWKDVRGLHLKKSFTKKFIVAKRDSASPRPESWLIDLPPAKTKQPLRIRFGEPLDYFLLMETIQVVDEKGHVVKGRSSVIDKESAIEFIPETFWKQGRYRLRIATYLEDLVGNNLNRPFDRDIKLQEKKEGAFMEMELMIGSN